MATDVLEFSDILQEARGSMHPGRLRLQRQSIIFKDVRSGRIDNISAGEIEKLSWILRAKGCCFRIAVKSGQVYFFDGLKDTDFEKLSQFCDSAFDKSLEKEEPSIKGWNWGSAKFEGNILRFEVENQPDFEIPLSSVSNCTPGKNEVAIALHQYDDAPISLMEMRFHVPDPDNSSVDMFCEKVMSRADVIRTTGDAIATFQEVSLVQPRGRYDIKLFSTFLQLHGKSFDYKIAYSTILRLFLLPHKDRHVFFVVALDPPIKQGQTRYHFLVCNFDKDQELTNFEVNLPEEDFKSKYDGKLSKEMSGPEFEVFSRVFKALVSKKLTIPGNFKAAVFGSQFLSCSYKAGVGFLYPLERGFMFVPKPPIYIRFEEIVSVNFARSQQGFVKSFDFEIDTKGGSSYNFSGIDKREYDPLFDYVREKQLPVKNKGEKGRAIDEQFSDEDAEEPDHYLERVKAEGNAMDVDEDESEDEDEEEDDDYDPNADPKAPKDTSSTSEDSDDEEASSKKKAKKEKRKSTSGSEASKSSDDSASESESESEDERPAKKSKPSKPVQKRSPKTKAAPAKKGKKAGKDPNAPKKPTTAFFAFSNEMRPQVKRENPNAGVADIAKVMGEKWKKLSDKSKYEKMAKDDKARYEREMVEYKKSGKVTGSTSSAKSPAKSPSKIKSSDLVPSDVDDSSTSESASSDSSSGASADEDDE